MTFWPSPALIWNEKRRHFKPSRLIWKQTHALNMLPEFLEQCTPKIRLVRKYTVLTNKELSEDA